MAPERPAALPAWNCTKPPRPGQPSQRQLLRGSVTGRSQVCRVPAHARQRSRSVSACSVASSLGAKAAAVRIWRARKSSPRFTNAHAQAARGSGVSGQPGQCWSLTSARCAWTYPGAGPGWLPGGLAQNIRAGRECGGAQMQPSNAPALLLASAPARLDGETRADADMGDGFTERAWRNGRRGNELVKLVSAEPLSHQLADQ